MSATSPAEVSLAESILGTWRMLSWTRTLLSSGETSDALGPNPFGYINYAPDGRVMVFVLRRGRARPRSNPPSDPEKIALFDSMFAYVGTYEVQSDRVIHTLDGSWNELWTGTQQTRLLSFELGRLVYRTHETVDPMDGKRCTYTVVFERA
ncbi:lipocalin-like domain-containing protein [Ralstonia soli]|uniref:Lipocalin-like domain-containing protein n=1 Tax=Ralstonia soli TaxID=2953896 RepID=A0ABT1AIT3_9RALS|nr:lipocalin-like domain-containing protein [Ralstonia soli]MCO5398236.1 lipocalin-like domain-containing protein [Ralstonia soli]